MKKVIVMMSVLLLMFSTELKANSNWLYSYEDALKVSKLLNKPILVDFWADWCGPCKKMDSDVWNKEEVNELMNNFVSVKIDIDSNKSLAMKYGVRGIPNVMILDSWGNTLHSSVGYKDKTEVSKMLKTYSINFSGINPAMQILEKDSKNVFSNMRVAQKFQNTSFVLEGEVKRALLKRCNYYLKSSKKYADKKDEALVEKIELLGLLNKSFSKKYKKVLKTLDKEFTHPKPKNNSLYYFIKFYCYNNLEMIDERDEALDLLKKEENNTAYMLKVDYLLKQV